MSIALLETACVALGARADEVVFVGGATIGLWITDPGAPAPRPTKDVDVIVEAATRRAYHAFERRLREQRFGEGRQRLCPTRSGENYQGVGVICRWLHADSGLVLDVMPTDASILGFSNRWQAAAVPYALRRELPGGRRIAAVSPPFLIATKLEAFSGRGRNDYMGSRDFADIVSLFDGRAELAQEIAAAPAGLRRYLATELTRHQQHPRFLDGIYSGLPPDAASQDRAESIVVPRMAAIAAAEPC